MTKETAGQGEKGRCRYIKAGGERCRVDVHLSDDDLCLWHDPERAELAKEIQSRGGQRGGGHGHNRLPSVTVDQSDAPPPPQSLTDCVAYASWLTNAVTTGLIDARTCKEAVMAVREVRMSLEKRDLERTVEDLKAQLKAEKARKGLKVS